MYKTKLYFQELGKKENKVSRLSEEIYTYENNVNEKFKEISKIKQAYNELEVSIKVKLATLLNFEQYLKTIVQKNLVIHLASILDISLKKQWYLMKLSR